MRKVLIWFAGFVVLLVGAALIGPGFLDWNKYKAEIASAARDATGRDLAINGDLDLAILPTPRLSAADIRLASIPGAANPDMVAIKFLRVSVNLLPLLRGKIEVDSVTLDEPVINLEKLADGRANWEIKPGGKPQASGESASPPVSLGNLRINRGTVIYRDGGSVTRIAGITMDVSAESLEGPFSARGELIAAGAPLKLEAAVGRLREATASPFKLSVTLPAGGGRAEIAGSIAALASEPRLTAKLKVESEDFRRAAAAMSGTSRTALPPVLAKPFSLDARVNAGGAGGEISELNMDFGGVRAAGGASVRIDKEMPVVAARLQVTRIDLDQWLAGAPAPDANAPAETAARSEPAAPFSLPGLNATLQAGVDAVRFNGKNLRGLELRAGLVGGVLTVQRAAMLMPGGGEAKLAGTLRAEKGKPRFAVQMDMAADNLRSVLEWAGADLSSIPSDRLRRGSFAARIDGDDGALRISGAKIGFDDTRIDAAATVALRARPAFGATVSMDRLNLDAYLPRGAGTAKNPATGKSKPAQAHGPLAMLQTFDANMRLSVGQLTVNKTTLRKIGFDGTLSGGKLQIKQASVGDAAGAQASISGTLGNLDKFPVFNGSVSADAADGARTLRALGVDVPPAAGKIGAIRLRGKAVTGAENLSLDISVGAAGGTVALTGKIDKFNTTPGLDINATANHPELARLLRITGNDPGVSKLGALAAKIVLKGGLERLSANVDVSAAGGKLAARGAMRNLMAKPAFDVTVAASHPAVGRLARTFSPRYAPQGGNIGPFKLDAVLMGGGDAYTLSKLSIDAGKASLRGTGALNTAGRRPALTAKLSGNVLDMNPFLPARPSAGAPVKGNAAASGRTGGSRAPAATGANAYFPKTPFDTAVFGLLDADLSVQAEGLIYRQFAVTAPTIAATLKDRVMTVKQLAGKMFDGAFNMTGQFDTRTSHSMKANVSVSKANIGKALFQAAEFDLQGGITDFSMNLTGTGRSPYLMIRSLNGGGALSSVNGSVKGFDLDAVNERLKRLNNAVDFIALFRSGMGGGRTKYNKLNGTFQIRNGVLTSRDIKLIANAGTGNAAGTADLPNWNMDFTGQFRLSGHKSSPPFGMRVVGPLDNPRRIFQIEQLQTFLLQRGVGTILKKLFPGQKGGSSPSSSSSGSSSDSSSGQQKAPAQEEKKVTPETIIQDVLPGIFRQLGR